MDTHGQHHQKHVSYLLGHAAAQAAAKTAHTIQPGEVHFRYIGGQRPQVLELLHVAGADEIHCIGPQVCHMSVRSTIKAGQLKCGTQHTGPWSHVDRHEEHAHAVCPARIQVGME